MRWQWRQEKFPGEPEANMATDAGLLAALLHSPDALPTVRIYRWDRPAVSIGRLQNESAVREVYPHLPLVRRLTGGRAVLHGDDLTITVATKAVWLPGHCSIGVLPAYRQIMGGLKITLDACGIKTTFGKIGRSAFGDGVNCFDHVASCDLRETATGRKIVGSAQRRERDALLQQMSILGSGVPNESQFLSALKMALTEALAVSEWCND